MKEETKQNRPDRIDSWCLRIRESQILSKNGDDKEDLRSALINFKEEILSQAYTDLEEACKSYHKVMLPQALKSDRESMIRKVEELDRKKHLCPFNDGEQNCDCYNNAIDDVLTIMGNR